MIPLYDRAGKKRRWPIITWLLVLINILVFIYEVRLSQTALTCVINDYSVIPKYLAVFKTQPSDPHCAAYSTPAPVVLTVISAMFLHAGWLHIAGNMLFLLIFGDNVEDRFGRVGYALFYLGCGVAGAAAQVAVAPHSAVPILGASGAIAGVLAAYFVLFPAVRVRTLLLVLVIDVPAWLLIGLWILFQALDGLATFQSTANSTSGVAFFAHLGGFALGLMIAIIYRWFAPRRPLSAKSNGSSSTSRNP
ncbi:MAG TPA: rhomboid family intramembrane serine protease [Ktedonobacterales bacterium]|nr:rhomboid family intramembrane serine protease [Ktedonobacterales bacterium]